MGQVFLGPGGAIGAIPLDRLDLHNVDNGLEMVLIVLGCWGELESALADHGERQRMEPLCVSYIRHQLSQSRWTIGLAGSSTRDPGGLMSSCSSPTRSLQCYPART